MAKSSQFINKKALGVFFAIILLAGLGFGIYMLVKPKADLLKPYNMFYELSVNETYADVNSYTPKIISKLNEVKADTNPNYDKSDVDYYINSFTLASTVANSLQTKQAEIIEKLAFTKDTDKMFLKAQQEMEKCYKTLNEKIESCNGYIQRHFVDAVATSDIGTAYMHIKNYTSGFCDYLNCLSDFYMHTGTLLSKYAINSFSVNAYTKTQMKAFVLFANNLMHNISSVAVDGSFGDLQTATNNLNNYLIVKMVDVNYLSNKDYYDALVNKFSKVSVEDMTKYLANNQFGELVNNLDDEHKAVANELKTNFFGI